VTFEMNNFFATNCNQIICFIIYFDTKWSTF